MSKHIAKVMQILSEEYKNHRHPTVRSTEKTTPFRTLISCLLSLRTQDKNTRTASERLFAVADTPERIVKLPLKKLEKLIYSSGYYHNKAKTIKHVSNVILKEYNGKVPKDFDKLLSIKGIGRKTANIVMLYGHGIDNHIPVDVHVHVIANRIGWVRTKNPDQTEIELMKIIPKKYWYELNTLFVLFGQNTCITLSPWCSRCPVRELCPRVSVTRSR